MKVDDDIKSPPTVVGLISTIFLFLILGGFTFQKCEVLINKKDVDVLASTSRNYFTPDDVFSYEENSLNFAAAFTAYDDVQEPILDPSIGSLRFRTWEWGPDAEGKV